MGDPDADLRHLVENNESLDGRLLGRVSAGLDCAFARTESALRGLDADVPFGDRFDALLAALTASIASDRDLAHLCLVEAPGLGSGALANRDATVSRLASLLERELSSAGLPSAPMAAEMAAGGIFEVFQRRLTTSGLTDPADLVGGLAALWVPVLTGARR